MVALAKGVAKVVVVLFNVLLAIMGIAFVVIGSLLASLFKAYTSGAVIKVELIWGPVAGLLVLGVWLIITSICGFLAVFGTNPSLAKSYLALLSIIIIIEVVLAICFIVYKQPINNAINEAIHSTINKAYAIMAPDISLQRNLDSLQRNLKCCGSSGPADYYNSTLTIAQPPDSCCVTYVVGCSTSTVPTKSRFFQKGCRIEIESQYRRYSNAIIAVGSVFGAMELIAIAYTIYVVCQKRESENLMYS